MIFGFGCKDNNQPDCMCTQELRIITVEITDSLNRPLPNLQTRTIDALGRTIIPSNKKIDLFDNVYVIADDSNVNMFSTSPSPIVFIVTDSVKSNTYNFVINTDDCKCHINKLEGPQRIIF
jgi:hypothetical protein